MSNFNFITKFLLTCVGADYSTMAQCTPTELLKYKIMGTCVFIPAFLALFSGGYAMYLISGSELLLFIFAPCWAWIIFTLDRAVVSNTRPGKISLGVVGRIFLSIVIAFTISEPVILRLFSDVIEDERVSIIDEKQNSATAKCDVQISTLEGQSTSEKNNVDALNKSYIQEVDGTGGSKVPFRGPIAKVKQEAYEKALNDYTSDESKRNTKLEKLQNERTAILQLVSDKDAHGFLGNLRILGRLSDEDNYVLWSTWGIRLLFLCIELVPIFIKLDSSGDVGLYHKIKDLNDEISLGVQERLQTEKGEMIQLEQATLIQKRKDELILQQVKGVGDSSLLQYNYLFDQIELIAKKRERIKQFITKEVKNESETKAYFNLVSEIHDSFVEIIKGLVVNSKQHFNHHNRF